MAQTRRVLTRGELLAMVRDVALHASPDAPATVSKRVFNEHRAAAGRDGCPDASNLCRRLKITWPELLDLALRDQHVARGSSNRTRAKNEHEGEGASRETALTALAIIATRLHVRTLTPDDYDQARREILNGSRGRHRDDLGMRLPTHGQISWIAAWDEMLETAGLERRPAQQGPRAGMRLVDALELFLCAQGYLPKTKALKRFTAEHSFAMENMTAGSLATAYKQLRERRADSALWTPPRPLGSREQPPWMPADQVTVVEELGVELPRRGRRGYWTLDRVMDGLQRALMQLDPCEELRMPALRRLAKQDPTIPQPSVVQKIARQHGTTFSALRDEAVATARLNS